MERSTLLRPWYSTLVAMDLRLAADDFHTPSDREAPPFWIEWTDPNHLSDIAGRLSVAERTETFEAMELFVLMAMHDPESWRTVIDELQEFEVFQGGAFKRVELSVPLRICGYDMRFPLLEDAVIICNHLKGCDVREGAVSNDYIRARSALEEFAARGGDPQPLTVPVRFTVRTELLHEDMRDVMPAIMGLAATQSAMGNFCADPDSRLAKLRSRLTEFHNNYAFLGRFDASFFDETLQLNRYGIKVTKLLSAPFSSSEAYGKSDVWMVRTLNALLGTTDATKAIGSDEINIFPREPSSLAILSAVAASKSLKSVLIDFTIADGASDATKRNLTHWIAYALFSPHASNSIGRVTLAALALTTECVRWMEELLLAEDPVSFLFPEDAQRIQRFRRLRVSTSTVQLMDPVDKTAFETHTLLEGLAMENLRVLGRWEHWWVVLLPGWGRAWVKKSDATVSLTPDTNAKVPTTIQSPSPQLRMLPHLAIMAWPFENETRAAVAASLLLLGPAIRHLSLIDSGSPEATWCQQIFGCCPQLENLFYDTAAPNQLRDFLDAFVNARCRHLRHLILSVSDISANDADVLIRMVQALATRSHPMANQLETFVLTTKQSRGDEEALVDPTILTQAIDMFSENHRLTRFKLKLPLATASASVVNHLHQDLATVDNVLLPLPLSLRQKVAFVSVVWGDRSEGLQDENVMQRLDSVVLSTIFNFAAARGIRSVELELPQEHNED